jgi:hypothetical protein
MRTYFPFAFGLTFLARGEPIPFPFQLLFWIPFFLILSLFALIMIISALARRQEGIAIFRPQLPNTLFAEQWRWGRCLSGKIGASRYLWVTVADGELWVCPHFPFNLVQGTGETSGVDYRIRGANITSVAFEREFMGGSKVRIHAQTPTGMEDVFEISVQDGPAFGRAIEAIRKPEERGA